MLGDCAIENGTIGPTLASGLLDIGFTTTGDYCAGCETTCASDSAATQADASALACIEAAQSTTTCGMGLAGAAGLAAIGMCCGQNPGSSVCARYCAALAQVPLLSTFVPGCN